MTGLAVDFDGVQVGIVQERGTFHAAIITRDGRPTTFNCTHGHHRPDTARPCVKHVVAAWRRWTVDEASAPVTLVAINDGTGRIIFECAVRTARKRFAVIVDDALEVVEICR